MVVEVLLAIILLLCTSEAHLNSKSQPRMPTLTTGFNVFVAEEEDRSYNATLSNNPATSNYSIATTTTTYQPADEAYELGGVNIIKKMAGKIRGRKKSNNNGGGGGLTFDLPLTLFAGLDSVLVTPVRIIDDEKSSKPGRVFFVGFDVAASNSWIYGVNNEEPNTAESTQEIIKGVEGPLYNTESTMELIWGGYEQSNINNFKFVSATNVITSSFKRRAASFDGLLGLGLKAEKEWRGITSRKKGGHDGDNTVVGKEWVIVRGDKEHPGTSLFHAWAGGKHGPGILKKPAFAFYVSPSGLNGMITFGGFNNEYFATNNKKKVKPFYIPVVKPTPTLPDWTLKFNYLRVVGGSKKEVINKNFNVVFMTTVHHAFMTNSLDQLNHLARAFKADVLEDGNNKGEMIVPCKNRREDLALVFKIKTKTGRQREYRFTGKEVFPREIVGWPNKDDIMCASFFKHVTDFKDYGLPDSKDFEWAIGTDFMKKYYVEFSRRSKRPDVPAYIAIALSSRGKDLEERGSEKLYDDLQHEACPRRAKQKEEDVEGFIDKGKNKITVTFKSPACGGGESSGGGESTSSSNNPPPQGKCVTSSIEGVIDLNGLITFGGNNDNNDEEHGVIESGGGGNNKDAGQQAATTAPRPKWRRWGVAAAAAAAGIAACGIAAAAASHLLGGGANLMGALPMMGEEGGGGISFMSGKVGSDQISVVLIYTTNPDGEQRVMFGQQPRRPPQGGENNGIVFMDGEALPAYVTMTGAGGRCDEQVIDYHGWGLRCLEKKEEEGGVDAMSWPSKVFKEWFDKVTEDD